MGAWAGAAQSDTGFSGCPLQRPLQTANLQFGGQSCACNQPSKTRPNRFQPTGAVAGSPAHEGRPFFGLACRTVRHGWVLVSVHVGSRVSGLVDVPFSLPPTHSKRQRPLLTTRCCPPAPARSLAREPLYFPSSAPARSRLTWPGPLSQRTAAPRQRGAEHRSHGVPVPLLPAAPRSGARNPPSRPTSTLTCPLTRLPARSGRWPRRRRQQIASQLPAPSLRWFHRGSWFKPTVPSPGALPNFLGLTAQTPR